LAVKDYLVPYENFLKKINDLMKKLSTIKGKAWLSKRIHLEAVIRNSTRWSSTFAMVDRFLCFKSILQDLTQREYRTLGLENLIFDENEYDVIIVLHKELISLNQVTLKLQEEAITMLEIRILFDFVILKFPSMGKYLADNAHIVKNPDFENGLVKLQKKQLLNGDEQEAIKSFAIDVIPQKHIDSNEEEDFVSQAFKKAKHGGFLTSGSLKIEAEYMDTSFVPRTSNICERFFSKSKLVYTDLRKSMDFETLETILFLKVNSTYWNESTVSKALRVGP
jgi:hypothetical protein